MKNLLKHINQGFLLYSLWHFLNFLNDCVIFIIRKEDRLYGSSYRKLKSRQNWAGVPPALLNSLCDLRKGLSSRAQFPHLQSGRDVSAPPPPPPPTQGCWKESVKGSRPRWQTFYQTFLPTLTLYRNASWNFKRQDSNQALVGRNT